MIKPTPRFLAYKVPMVNVGTEKIPIKGKGYMMVSSNFILRVLRNADPCKNADDCNYDQQFYEGET